MPRVIDIAICVAVVVLALLVILPPGVPAAERLPGTEPLQMPKDVVAAHLAQAQGYFLRRIEQARAARDGIWKPDFKSPEAYQRSLAEHRVRCRAMLGLDDAPTDIAHGQIERLGESADCRIERITLPRSTGRAARGIVFAPRGGPRHPAVIVCPDALQWPEAFTGLSPACPQPKWLAELLGRGAVVYVPQSIERLADHPYCELTKGKDRRWILYRLGYGVGRTMPGLDVDDVRAAVDYLASRADVDAARIAVAGIAQGGMTALFAAAVEPRLAAAAVVDYFQSRQRCWQEPVDRRLPGQLLEFGDAELAALVAPRRLIVVSDATPAAETARAARFYRGLGQGDRLQCEAIANDVERLVRGVSLLAEALSLPAAKTVAWPAAPVSPEAARAWRDRHMEDALRYLRARLDASPSRRAARWQLDDCRPAEFPARQSAMLEEYHKLVGEVSTEGIPLRPRSECALTTDRYTAYRVTLAVTDGVEVYGNLLVPRGASRRMPAVVCQHGLSGVPEMITGLGWKEDTPYHEFGRKLAERGYVVFAPLVLHYHPVEWTNSQARQADAVGMMRVALVVAQTQRVVDFLQTLPCVDPQRIGYYGLSYGGYCALWVPPLVKRLAPVVVSGHFNDWRWKTTSDAVDTSYLRHPDEDFYTFDVLHRFTHVELVAMMAPRPVCIEFGLRDGITTPERTLATWKSLSAIRDRLGLTDRIQLAQFDGVHEVRGVESFEFLSRFLQPAAQNR